MEEKCSVVRKYYISIAVELCYNEIYGNTKSRIGGEYLDKYEFSMKLDELKRLAANGQFRKAGKVLETIEIKRIKTVKELYVIVDVLIENEKYDQAKDILIGISKKLKSRRVYHQIIDVCIKAGQVDSAKKYMKDFQKLAPKDPYNYVFQYQVAQLAEEGINRQIEILEGLKQYEYMEKWAYELAKAYYRAGRDSDCILECNDLILWFGDGVFVEKAKLLKQYLTEATTPQQILGKVRQIQKEQPQQGSSEDKVKESNEAKDRLEDNERVKESGEDNPSYQGAFDYIEDMELREQEHKRQMEEYEKTESNQQEDESPLEETPTELGEAEPEEKTLDAAPKEQSPKDSIANERQVRELVEETQDCLAAQIEDLFYEEEVIPIEPEEQSRMEEIVSENDSVQEEPEVPVSDTIEAVDDVDKLIRRRRQRVTTKKLNTSIRAILGEEAEVTDYLGQFARMYSLGEDLLKSLESIIAMHNNNVILCICGQSTDVQSYFSRKLAKLLSAMNLIPSQNFVLFRQEKLEGLSIETYQEQLRGGCIVVENVHGITEELLDRLQTLSEYQCQIILEFQKEVEGSETMQEQQYKIQQDAEKAFCKFAKAETLRLDSFDEEDYLGFANDFLAEKEYSLEPEAEEYLLSSIKKKMEQKNIDVFDQVMDEIAKAYHCANQRNRVELRNIAESGNYQDAMFMSIRLTDFVNEN